ncbi:hypothetical protein BH09PLA1_BH09PLA1_15210 [soil metagenome]
MTESSAPQQLERSDDSRWPDALAIAIGTLITLVVSGYQFGRGNHTVYLLEGLRIADPTLFRNDWFVTSTLQYHAIFSWFTAVLMRLNILEPAFLCGYLAIAILWHVAWLKFTQRLGGSRITYLFSVLLFYLSAAGISLGVYQFLQDGCFLPSNVSTIAMLWGFYFWTIDRRIAAGLCLGISGLFHLNFAVMALAMWGMLWAWDLFDVRFIRTRRSAAAPSIFSRSTLIGSALVLIPCLFNIIHALQVKLRESGSIPLKEFVDIYVRFRHTHHFNAMDWPAALWIAFLWPVPAAIYAWRRRARIATPCESRTLSLTVRIAGILLALNLVSLIFAGIWFVSESLVQLMFWRFSIYIKLLTCIGAAYVVCDPAIRRPRARAAILWIIPLILALGVFACLSIGPRPRPPWMELALHALQGHREAFILFTILSFIPALMHSIRIVPRTPAPYVGGLLICVLVVVIGWDRWLGWGMTPEPVDADYLKLCHWAREATPVDAIFLVPPSDTAFRLEARRAIVVNFKHVPQLSGEITVWLDRLEDLIGTRDVDAFPRDYMKLLPALDARYESRSPEQLMDVARRYAARYIVVDHELGPGYRALLTYRTDTRRYFVYDVGR